MDFKQAEALLEKQDITINEFAEGVKYIMSVLDRHERGLGIAELSKKYLNKAIENKFDKGIDGVFLQLMVCNAYTHSDYAWRARSSAKKGKELLDVYAKRSNKSERYMIADCYERLGDYFASISAQKDALDCYDMLFTYAPSTDKKGAALVKIVICHNRLEDDYKIDLSDDEIRKYYPEGAARLIDAVNKKGYLKVDPIENSDKFQEVYDEVHEQARKIIEKDGDLHMPQQLWGVLTECYAERGIEWKSPQRMNPGVMFD